MAAVAAQLPAALPRYSPRPIIEDKPVIPTSTPDSFDPSTHLAYKKPEEIISMEQIGYSKDKGISPVAVSQPFSLFSKEAVQNMRGELMRPEVLEKYRCSSNLAALQVRGYVKDTSPFTYDAWTNPETLRIVSEIAGVDLVPAMDYEISHVNFMVKSEKEAKDELDSINKQKEYFATDEGIAGCPWEDDKPVVGWHHDSYPFVCVLMLSDCTDMVGGETALVTGNNQVMRVRGPGEGHAVILQGRYITHQALRCFGAKERITAVTSFRPRAAHLKDESVLDTIRPISNLSQVYYEFAENHLERVEERIRNKLKELRVANSTGRKTDTPALKKFLREQIDFLTHTDGEIVEEDKVTAGHIEEVDGPTIDIIDGSDRPTKRQRDE